MKNIGAATLDRNCPACHGHDYAPLGEPNGFEILRCRSCRALYTAYLPAPGEAMHYDSYYTEKNLVIPEFIHQRLDQIVAGFSGYRQINRLLEVGFGEGSLLQAAKRAAWDVEGVEVSRPAVEHARTAGVKTFCGTLEDAKYENAQFDVVVASELIEHITEPKALAFEVARILRPGGLLWATTPHAHGLSAKLVGLEWSVVSPPEHLQLFSIQGIRKLLIEAGFRDIRIATHGVNLFEIIHHFRRGGKTSATPDNGDTPAADFDRVATGYKLNETLTTNSAGRIVKYCGNGILSLSGLGDSLKIRAVR